MRFLRRLTLLAVTAVGASVLAGPALAAPRPALPFTVGSTHFLVHYQSDLQSNGTWAITQTQAGDIAALAERAYTAELADGYAAPLSDAGAGGDNRIDIYVADLSTLNALGYTDSDNFAASPTDAFIVLNGADPGGMTQLTIAHELFHAIQFGIWLPAAVDDYWLLESSAEWMGYRASGYPNGVEVGPSDMALDCRDPLFTNRCDLVDDYRNNGYSRWPFWEFLVERYGASFVKDVFTQGAGGAPSATAALSQALVAKGTTLTAMYNAWSAVELNGAYTVKDLQGRKPVTYASVDTGVDAGALPTVKVPLNHLSTRFVKFVPGDNDASHVCYNATLALTVTIPVGTLSAPTFYWDAKGSTPVALTVNGSTATANIPWDTCTYTSQAGYLMLSNASLNVDAADFVVDSTLTVTTTRTTPDPPPDPVSINTPVTNVSNADVAPTLELFGPEILKLSATDTQLRLIASSSGPGTVQARLGSTLLGTVRLRGGNNDLRFKLPSGILRTLRRSAAASNTLTLTPVSLSGAAGSDVTRVVRIAPAPKPKRRK